jgi:hypothetical protein
MLVHFMALFSSAKKWFLGRLEKDDLLMLAGIKKVIGDIRCVLS